MKSFKNFLQFSFVIAVAAFMAVSCASDQTETTVDSMPNIESNEDITTRAVKKRVDSKAYYYKNLAVFKEGQATVDLAQLADLQGKQVNFVVIYDAIAPWAEGFAEGNVKTTGDDMLNGLMASYELEIVKQFEIDDTNEGFVLEPNAMLDNAVETAREISMIEHILMVQVKEVPSDVTETETAANN